MVNRAKVTQAWVAFLVTAAAMLTLGVGSASAANLVTNGSFETGDFTGWTNTNSTSCPWTVFRNHSSHFCDHGWPGWPATISSVKGRHFADVGWDGVAGKDAMLGQTVSLPHVKRVKLTWSDRTFWDTKFGATQRRIEYLDILRHGTVVHSYKIRTLKPDTTGTTGWIKHTLNLSSYAGKKVQIRFRLTIPETFTGPATFALDAVELTAKG